MAEPYDSVAAMSEDDELLADWLAGPGARPTPADTERWAEAARDGRSHTGFYTGLAERP